MLAVGHTVADACTRAGVGESTAYRWLREPDFRRRVAELRKQATSEATGVLATATRLASLTLAELLKAEQPGVRLQAARSVLEFAHKFCEVAELEERLLALESAQHSERAT